MLFCVMFSSITSITCKTFYKTSQQNYLESKLMYMFWTSHNYTSDYVNLDVILKKVIHFVKRFGFDLKWRFQQFYGFLHIHVCIIAFASSRNFNSLQTWTLKRLYNSIGICFYFKLQCPWKVTFSDCFNSYWHS